MGIWHRPFDLEYLQRVSGVNMVQHVGIRFSAFGDDWLEATMPVDARTTQPYGIVHGGASVVLAETLGSTGANLSVDYPRLRCVGQEISASHLRPVAGGHVTGRASPLHLGRRTQVWHIEIRDDAGKRTCVCRLTMAVLESVDSRPS